MNVGPSLTTAFHVIGTMFDRTYADGNPANLWHGPQTYNIAPGAGAMVELNIPDPGLPFVRHSFAYTALGVVGLIRVDPNAPTAPASYATMTDAFSASVEPFGKAGDPSTSPNPASPTVTASPSVADCEPKGTSSRSRPVRRRSTRPALAMLTGLVPSIARPPGVITVGGFERPPRSS